MTDIALLMTGVLTTGQPSPPIAPQLPLVQRDSNHEKSTQGQLSQIVPTAQITPPEFMQPEATAQAAASRITIKNESTLNPIEINILSEISCLVGSRNFQVLGKDNKHVIAESLNFHVSAPEMLLSSQPIPKLVGEWGNTVRSFQKSPLKESKKIMLASTYFVGFQLASDNLPTTTPSRRAQRPTGKQGSNQIRAQMYNSQSLPALRFGDSGVAVRVLQRLLLSSGYNGVQVDGMFGVLTEAAVKAFQNKRSLAVDGIVGQRTWYELTR